MGIIGGEMITQKIEEIEQCGCFWKIELNSFILKARYIASAAPFSKPDKIYRAEGEDFFETLCKLRNLVLDGEVI
jgi:hypothetical protein